MSEVTVAVDPVRCAAHGLCAWILDERIGLDEWGYPEVSREPITDPRVVARAERAARACPRRALFVTEVAPPSRLP